MYDYIIIGSGIAGLFTALLASKHGKVLVLTKAALEESNTRYAQGGIAAAMSPGDSPRLHYEDTIAAGAGLSDERAVDILTREAPGRIHDLLALNVPFDRHGDELALGLEGAHRERRVLHAGGDATGFHIERSLCRALQDSGVEVIEGCFVTDLLIEQGRAVGVSTLSGNGSLPFQKRLITGRHIVLASGGAGQLFSHTTNPQVATGDGLAVAYRAGAELVDMEFYQFHPTALAIPGLPSFLISEAVRGEGAYLRNADGERFMLRIDDRGELAPRDVVAKAIAAEMSLTGQEVFLDLSHLSSSKMRDRFPTIDAYCKKAGLDMASDRLPVAPAAHYLMGGVQTNLWGETNVPGLYACGEVACTRVHGANRLASNSLLEGLVFGARIVERTVHKVVTHQTQADAGAIRITEAATASGNSGLGASLSDLQKLMWEKVGLVRDQDGLSVAQSELNSWDTSFSEPALPARHELMNMTLIGRLMASAALARQESRGAHTRTDFPAEDNRWRRHIILSAAASARVAREVK